MSLSMSKFINIWTLFWLLFKAHSESRRTLAPALLHIIFKEELQLHTYKPNVALMNHCVFHYIVLHVGTIALYRHSRPQVQTSVCM